MIRFMLEHPRQKSARPELNSLTLLIVCLEFDLLCTFDRDIELRDGETSFLQLVLVLGMFGNFGIKIRVRNIILLRQGGINDKDTDVLAQLVSGQADAMMFLHRGSHVSEKLCIDAVSYIA